MGRGRNANIRCYEAHSHFPGLVYNSLIFKNLRFWHHKLNDNEINRLRKFPGILECALLEPI